MIAIPLFGDQLYNAAIVKRRRTGIYLDVREMHHEQVLSAAISKLLQSPQIYKHNADILKRKLALDPFKPADKLVKLVEFAAEFEDFNELNMPSEEEIPFLIYYSLDVLGVVGAALLGVAFFLYATLRWLFCCVISRATNGGKVTKKSKSVAKKLA